MSPQRPAASLPVVLAVALVLACPAASAQIVKCVDGKGRVEYATTCPPGMNPERRITAPAPMSGPEGAPAPARKSLAEQEAEFRKRQAERGDAAAKSDKERADAERRRANCENAQGQLRALEGGQRIVRFDPATGERIFVGDEERNAELEQARKSVDNWCKPAR